MKLLLNPVTSPVTMRTTAGVPAAHQKFSSFLCARLDTNWRLWLFVTQDYCQKDIWRENTLFSHCVSCVFVSVWISPSEDTVMLCRRDICSTLTQLYTKHTTKAVPILMITFLSFVLLSPFLFLKKFCLRPMEMFFYWLPGRASITKTSDTSVPLVANCLGCN